MKFYSLLDKKAYEEDLSELFSKGHRVGAVTVSENGIFVKKGLKTYYIAYNNAERIFRRVRMVDANVCCGKGQMNFDYLVVMADNKEVLEVQLPGSKAAKLIFDEMKGLSPETDFEAPKKAAEAV